MVPRVAMFTMAGDTRLIIGESEGTGVSPTAAGMAADAIGAITGDARQAAQARIAASDAVRLARASANEVLRRGITAATADATRATKDAGVMSGDAAGRE